MPEPAIEEIQRLMQQRRHVWIEEGRSKKDGSDQKMLRHHLGIDELQKENLKLKCLLVCDNQNVTVKKTNEKLNEITQKLFGSEMECC